jgi:hypothetical protein
MLFWVISQFFLIILGFSHLEDRNDESFADALAAHQQDFQ